MSVRRWECGKRKKRVTVRHCSRAVRTGRYSQHARLHSAKSGVKERVKHVLNYKKPAFGIVLVACVVCIVTVVCFLTNPKVENGNDTQLVNGTEETAATDVVSGTESGNTDIPESSDNVFEQSFGETEENQAYEQVLDEYRDMVQNRFYLDELNTDVREENFGPDIGA